MKTILLLSSVNNGVDAKGHVHTITLNHQFSPTETVFQYKCVCVSLCCPRLVHL